MSDDENIERLLFAIENKIKESKTVDSEIVKQLLNLTKELYSKHMQQKYKFG